MSIEAFPPPDRGPSPPAQHGPRGPVPTADFTYHVDEDRWEWSDGVYQLHGFARHDVVPTTDLMLAHCHPEDRGSVASLLRTALSEGRPLVCRYRIVDAAQHQRTVVAFAHVSRDAAGRAQLMEGLMADVTDRVRGEIQEATRTAVAGVTASRSVIEEAKGALMGHYGITADEAFTVLKVLSSHTNCKVRSLAGELVELLARRPPVDTAVVVQDLEQALHRREDRSRAG